MKTKKSFPIIGIGASAGGLSAFEAFFKGLPSEGHMGMAFILVQHLAPDHKSLLTEIIQRYTKMTVLEVKDGVVVEPNFVYIIPPNRNMVFLNGSLHLFETTVARGHNFPIDFFFQSLAEDLKERAICIILSGTGSDGTLGLRRIKGEGGMSIVQNPETSEFEGMPQNAIATNQVDFILEAKDMGQQILNYVEHKGAVLQEKEMTPSVTSESNFKKVFVLIRKQTGHDFSKYKQNTIYRRVERRLAVQQIKTMEEYVKYLQKSPIEIEALFHDLLIGVTSFFRDKDAFEKLADVIIPAILEEKQDGSDLRIWCTGCSTGEEAYSIAILFQESIERLNKNIQVQIFATDIDAQAITYARSGIYPASIVTVITPERLQKYFVKEAGSNTFRIVKSIRDMLVFSEQSIIKDPPFSRLDLITCRNLLIYLGAELQKKIIPLFHYALNAKGILFLGNSETIGNNENLFLTIDSKLKIYQKKEDLYGFKKPSLLNLQPRKWTDTQTSTDSVKILADESRSLREICERNVLKECSMAAAVVNDKGVILYLHGRFGKYLELTSGEVGINNILSIAKDGLKKELTVAFQKAVENNETMRVEEINVKMEGHFTKIKMIMKYIKLVNSPIKEDRLYIVLIDEIKEGLKKKEPQDGEQTPYTNLVQQVEDLRIELNIKEQSIEFKNDELETTIEELKSSNEEMQSVNEELQSTNEELETSKEEMQSVNEELTTVNSELEIKVRDLSQVSNDMNNLLAGTNIATIFLDLQQKLARYTPTAIKIINLISTDVGRPIAHIVSNLKGYNTLTEDVGNVIDTLVPKEIEVETLNNKWYNMIIQPYRTLENVVEGIVLTFVDITELKFSNSALEVAEFRLRKIFESVKEGIIVIDGITGKITDVNPAFTKLVGYTEKEMMNSLIWEIKLFKEIVSSKEDFDKLLQDTSFHLTNKILVTAKGQKKAFEIISNTISTDSFEIVQWNLRNQE